ncbi:uncharacterized protein N7458_012389 [Penicillium daleae]|uniref:Uncharacterized protein n=1 Tax=Penicillium daleae TaxID=63821 RepID=A0AAD6BVU6_9EURO|nr:uncharacterized protein N7458_012389 [Penicillium daleae]KAJ5433233.1 hypothetical protein N7458_012389 [Penicillium daleae]
MTSEQLEGPAVARGNGDAKASVSRAQRIRIQGIAGAGCSIPVEERDQHENKGGLPELIDVTKCNTVGTAFRGDESMEMTSASFLCQFRREGRKEAALRELALESEAKQSSSSKRPSHSKWWPVPPES